MLRGGPSFLVPGEKGFHLNVNTDQSKKVYLNAGSYQGVGNEDSFRFQEYWSSLNYRPMNSFSISFSPQYGLQNTRFQYVSTITSDDNPRYLFGKLDMKTLSFTWSGHRAGPAPVQQGCSPMEMILKICSE